MFSFLRKPPPQLQIYGKLPIAKDYLRIGCSEGLARELREWADRVFSGAVEGAAPRLAGPMRFAVSGPGGVPILGSVWPSSDAGELRPFPFFALVECSKKGLAEDWSRGRPDRRDAWRQMEALWPSLGSFENGEGLLTSLRGTALTEADAPEADGERPAWSAWLAGTYGDRGAAGLGQTIAALDRLATTDRAATCRLPLASGMAQVPQVHGWWTILREFGLARPDEAPTVFFPGAESRSSAAPFVVFSSTLPSDVRWLGPATPEAPLGPGDLCCESAITTWVGDPPLENEPPLADSLRGALALHRARR